MNRSLLFGVRLSCRDSYGWSYRSFTSTSKCLSEEPPALSKLKRGTGGRASFNGMVATVFGAPGYLGKSVLTHLAKTGTQIIIPYRSDFYLVRDIKVIGDLGQILYMPFNLDDDECLRKSMKYSDIVINLIGTEFDTRNFTIEQAIGEEEVRRERPDATIFRPAEMWGHSDRFLCYFASSPRRIKAFNKYYIPLWACGEKTIKQPVYAGDVARGIINCLHNPESLGQTYEAVGPHRYRLDDIVKWIYFVCRYIPREVEIVPMNPILLARIYVHEKMARFYPYLTFERLERESATDILSGCPTLDDLNVKLTKLEDRINHIVYLYRWRRHYWDAVGEFPEPPTPPIQLS
ncbi:unnamed protein product [Heterobilharzia americana]|nr:unnamed protein product [Heterobilharzia americana]